MSGETAARPFRFDRFAVAGVLTLLAAITFAHPSATRLHAWPWRGWVLVLWLIPCGLVLHAMIVARRGSKLPKPVVVGLTLLGVTVLASALASPFRALSLPHVWPTFSGIALVVWLHGIVTRTPSALRRVASLFAGGAGLLAVGSLMLWWWQVDPPRWSVRNDFPFGHSNYTAGALVLALPWLAWAAVYQRGLRRAAWLCAVACALAALLTTGSRGGVLALTGMTGLAAVWLVARARWSGTRRTTILTAAVVVGAVAVFSNARLRDLALGRGWSEAARESNLQRSAMLEGGLELGVRRPLLGWGPGAVPLAYPLVRGTLPGGVDNVLQLHNTPAQVWATLGVPGILAMVLIGASLLRRAPAAAGTGIGGAAVCSLIGYAAFSLTDHQLDIPFLNWMSAASVALLLASAADRERSGVFVSTGDRRAGLVFGAALLVPLVPTARDLLARRAYATSDLERAIAWMPEDAFYRHRLASDLLAARNRSADARERRELTVAAIEHLRLSLPSGARSEYAHFNLGWLLLDADPSNASAHFRAAAHLAPTRGGVYLGLALAELGRENTDAAVRALAIECLNDPLFSTAPIWELPDFEPLRPHVIRQLDTLVGVSGDGTELVKRRTDWIRWWSAHPSLPDVPTGFSRASRAFAEAERELKANQPLADRPPFVWARWYEAWLRKDWSLVTPDAEFAAALERRAGRHTGDFHAFLRADSEEERELIQSTRRVRPGSGVLAFHPDGPPLMDVYLVQENRLHAILGKELFPPKGALPAPLLLSWLADDAGNPPLGR